MKKDKVINIIKKLREMNINNGASEGEIIAAIEKADRLMRDYQINEIDLVLADDTQDTEIISKETTVYVCKNPMAARKHAHPVQELWSEISALTDTKLVLVSNGTKFTIIGERESVEYADYLFTIIKNYIDAASDEWRKNGRAGLRAFHQGIVGSIREKLVGMNNDRLRKEKIISRFREKGFSVEDAEKGALILVERRETVKNEVEKKLHSIFPRLRTARTLRKRHTGIGYSAGYKAGKKLNLEGGIGHSFGGYLK